MISKHDKQAIITLATKYHAKRVLLFGSALSSDTEGRDIDIAVEGIPDELFFTFYGELMRVLSKPVDVVDLSRPTRLTLLILAEGELLYA